MNPSIPLSVLRADDILVLLAIGGVYELSVRTVAYRTKTRTRAERSLRSELHQIRYEIAKSRSLGPSAFVKTSKLERSVLAKEKELIKIEEGRKKKVEGVARVVKNVTMALNLTLFFLFYSVRVLSIDGRRAAVSPISTSNEGNVVSEEEAATTFMNGMLFPLSYIGFGLRFAGIGLAERASSFGALVVFWSAQSTVGKISEAVEAMLVR